MKEGTIALTHSLTHRLRRLAEGLRDVGDGRQALAAGISAVSRGTVQGSCGLGQLVGDGADVSLLVSRSVGRSVGRGVTSRKHGRHEQPRVNQRNQHRRAASITVLIKKDMKRNLPGREIQSRRYRSRS